MCRTRVKINDQKCMRQNFKRLAVNVFFPFVLGVLIFMPVHRAQAVAFWGDAIPAAILKQKMEVIYEYVKHALVGTMQNVAMQVLYVQMQQVIGKTGIVTNFYENIYTFSKQQSELYTKDLITQTLRGQTTQNFVAWQSASTKTQTSNWSLVNGSEGYSTTVQGGDTCTWKNPDTGETVSSCQSYASTLQTAAKQAITDSGLGTYSVPQYCSDANDTFNSKNSGYGWSCFLSQLEWNPIKISLDAKNVKQTVESQLANVNQTQAIAYKGYYPKTVNGKIVVPGSTLGEMMNNVLDIPNKAIASMQHPGQLGVILSGFMQQLVSEVTNYGFTLVRQQIDNQISKLNTNIQRAVNTKTSASGPQTIYETNY